MSRGIIKHYTSGIQNTTESLLESILPHADNDLLHTIGIMVRRLLLARIAERIACRSLSPDDKAHLRHLLEWSRHWLDEAPHNGCNWRKLLESTNWHELG